MHFEHPDARHDDDAFEAYRDVRHHLLQQAVAYAEYVDRRVRCTGVPGRPRAVQIKLDRLAEIHKQLLSGKVPSRKRPQPLAEAAGVLAKLDEQPPTR